MSNKTQTKWDKPQIVDKITLAFPANVVGTLLPVRPDVPDDFRSNWCRSDHPWCALVNKWFGNGLDGNEIKVKDGIDRDAALRQLGACMRSFEPKHEDKIAGVAWLMSKWFDLSSPQS